MNRAWIAAVAVAVLLTGCQKKSEPAGESYAAADSAPMMAPPGPEERMGKPEAAAEAAPAADMAASPDSAPAIPAPVLPMMAYEYAYRLEVPATRLSALQDKHEKACVDAGPQVCQVVGSQTSSAGRDNARGHLELRASPAWIKRFRDGLAADTEEVGGRVANAAVEAEDLTRVIVDTEAQLRAKKTLRDRLQALLASRPGKLQELLEVERELARVQGEIDATESQLAVMRTRVATSKLTIEYQAASVVAPDSAFRPVGEALNDVVEYVMGGLAFIILMLAALFPFFLVFGPVVWLIVRWMRRRKAARLAASGEAPPPPPPPKPAASRPRGLRS